MHGFFVIFLIFCTLQTQKPNLPIFFEIGPVYWQNQLVPLTNAIIFGDRYNQRPTTAD
jgi:hypothetical protein